MTPSNDGGGLLVRFTVNTPQVEPVGQFLDRLEDAGAFTGLRSVEEQAMEDGTYNVVCEGRYLGPGAAAATAAPTDDAPGEPLTAPARAGGN